jgi:hypothetical protein
LQVRIERQKACCSQADIATIGRGAGPHFAELTCASCGRHRGWLSKSTAQWIENVINKFGAPDTPIVLRRPLTEHDGDADGQ